MTEEKNKNKVTSHLSETEKQELYKNARNKNFYGDIWKTVGKCVFCDLRDKYILHEEHGIVLTINIYPYIDGQMMIIPRRHVRSPKELTHLEWDVIRKFIYIGKKMIRKVHSHKGIWSIIREGGEAAQMSVTDHLHIQLIPFDEPDLCAWKYRELRNTPLENVELYKNESKSFFKAKKKFEEKYTSMYALPIVCDVAIINTKQEVLIQERKDEFKFEPDIMTIPGGHVDATRNGLQEELIREVEEEVGITLEKDRLALFDSRVTTLQYVLKSSYMKVRYKQPCTFIWNTYVYTDFLRQDAVKPGDDCKEIKWLSKEEVERSDRLSHELKETLLQILST